MGHGRHADGSRDGTDSIDKPELAESVVMRDAEVNRAYFLLIRLLKSALNNKRTAEHFQLTNDKVLNAYSLTINLENFADAAKQLTENIGSIKKKESKVSIFLLEKNQLKLALALLNEHIDHFLMDKMNLHVL